MPLALTRLRLSHFRSHKSADLTPGPGAVAMFGPNGAGKTNLLEAVSLLSPGRGLRRATAEEIIRRPEALGWVVRADLSTPTGAHEIELRAEPDQPRKTLIDGKPAAQTDLARRLRVLWLTPTMDRLWLEGATERRRFLDRIAMSFAPEHADAALAYEKAMRERNRLLKDRISDDGWFRSLETQLAQHGQSIKRGREAAVIRLTKAQAAAQTAFPTAALTIEDQDTPEGEEAHLDALARGRARDFAAGRTLTGPHRSDLIAAFAAKGTPARQSSTGEQKALLISLILANARALAEDLRAPPILLLDEVAAHLDSDRRAALYDEVAALGAQTWMTGTGRDLFSDLGSDAVRYAVSETGGLSTVRPVPPN
ncbi:MAG: DNA replication/repair protein RecF [Pseudomonadota bacterium]